MQKTFVSCLSAAVLVTIVAAACAQQPIPAVNSTPQPVTAYTPAAPGALDRGSTPAQPQPNAATQTEMGDRLDASVPRVPSAFGRLHEQPQAEMTQEGPFGGGQSTIAGIRPGELGVWLGSSGGAGVEVRRITAGGPAEMAGLQAGDIILQVNGQGATSPQAVSQMIRRTPAGESVTIEIWRDGQQQELQAMLRPVREQYETAYRGESTAIGGSSDLAARTIRLEEQLTMVMQELRALRQEMTQLRSTAGSAATSATPAAGALTQPAADPGFNDLQQPATPAAAAQPTTTSAPAAATIAPATEAAQPDPFTDEAIEPAAEPAAEPATTEPAAEDGDVFGAESTEETTTAEPEAEAPATEAEPAESTDADAGSDDLFE